MVHRLCALLLFLVAASGFAQTTIDNDDSCDIGVAPAATLLLPYFEVDLSAPRERARTTLFTVTNVTASSQIAHVTIWSDWAYPVLTFDLFLTGYDVQSINLYDVIVNGQIARTSTNAPRGEFSERGLDNQNFLPSAAANCSPQSLPTVIPDPVLADVRSGLTLGTYSLCGSSRIGGTHTNAIGYATVDVVATCNFTLPTTPAYYTSELLFDNVLIGDFMLVNPNPATGNQALGEPMVHIRAVPEGGPAGSVAPTNLPYTFYDRYTPPANRTVDRRQPLPSTFAARYIQGGSTGFLTNFCMWREGVTGADAACSNYVSNRSITVSEPVRFDERENPTSNAPLIIICTFFPTVFTTPTTSSMASANSSFPPLTSGDIAGWMYLNLHNNFSHDPNRRCGQMRASQNWVVVGMEAEGRYGVAFPAASLGNGCSPWVVSPTDRLSNRIGPRP